ncbi:MAG: NFACT family protein, partial [Clostridia bacterium]|nr:NFACT family protein [Clostridia bacterium]
TAKFFDVIENIKNLTGTPYIVKNSDGIPVEYAFMEIRQYGNTQTAEPVESFGKLIDMYFGERSRDERLHRKAGDLFKLLSNAETRIIKKMNLQRDELAACDDGEKFKLWGDLITANIWQLERGMTECRLVNYYSEDCEEITVPLDKRLSPSANAQVYYKKYNKSKAARVHLTA